MKKNNLFALSLTAISSLGIAASLLFARVSAKSAVMASAYSDADFAAETELVNGEELTVNINNFSSTDYGVSLGVKFATGSESLTNDTSKYYEVGEGKEQMTFVVETVLKRSLITGHDLFRRKEQTISCIFCSEKVKIFIENNNLVGFRFKKIELSEC